MFRLIISTVFLASTVLAQDLQNLPMPQFSSGGSTLPPPFGMPVGNFQGSPSFNGMNPSNGMPMIQQQPQSGYPMNPPPSMGMFSGNNQGPQMAQLAGFTNGFADMIGMSPSPIRGFPGALPEQFNLIDSVTNSPVVVKKRQAFPQNGNLGQSGTFGQGSSNSQPGALGQPGMMGQPGSFGGQQQMNGGNGMNGQQPLGPAGIPIVGNSQGSFQNPNQPFGSPQSGLGGNSMIPQQQQQPGMNPIQG